MIDNDWRSFRSGLVERLPRSMRYLRFKRHVMHTAPRTYLYISFVAGDGTTVGFAFDPLTETYKGLADKIVLLY